MKLRNLLAGAAAVAVLGLAGAASAAPVYVGSWFVDDGVSWTTNPPVYSGQEAAAFLFGGVASDYSISTISSNVADINFMAFYDGWGDDETCGYAGPCAQDMHIDFDDDGYENPFETGAAYSALVYDHNLHLQNFAFRDDGAGVPEPASWALMIGGFGLAGSALRRRAVAATA